MYSTILQTKLTNIDSACEEGARAEIDHFYKNVRYDGSRFIYPSFQEVASVWLRLIREKEKKLISETKNILDAMTVIDEAHLIKINSIAEMFFLEVQYIDRLKGFSEGVARRAASYGQIFNPDIGRLDLADAAYRAQVENLTRAARKNFFVDLQLYISKRGLTMGFSSLMTDIVSLMKKDGSVIEGIKASVQKEKIFITGSTVLIESGDQIRRVMSNGGEETFVVIDPGFHEKFGGIPSGYQMIVRKLGLSESKNTGQTIHQTWNLLGNNARVNQNSIDNSTNFVSINPDVTEYISALRDAIRGAGISDFEKNSAMEVIDAVDVQFQSQSPSKPVVTALLKALPHAANITAIVTSILSLF